MSFIFDDKRLIQELVDAGNKSLQKSAQLVREFPGDSPDVVPSYEIAQKLLFNLQRDLGDQSAPSAGAPIGIEGGDGTQPNPTALPKDLRTLGDFLQWAAAKKITWQGQRFAWTPEEVQAKRDQPDDPTQKAWEFTSLRTNRDDRKVDRQPETVFAYADKDGLINYLSYLRDSEDAKTNKVLAFMLATLIGEANAYLRQAGEKTIDPRKKPGTQDVINPETIIDVIPDPLEMDKWNDGLDEHPFQNNNDTMRQLRYKDIQNPGAFQAWFRNRNVKVTTPAEKGKQPQSRVFQATSSDGDPCIAIHILYKRANYLRSVAVGDDATVQNYSKAVAQYLQQITTLGKNYNGPDGKPCAVTSPGTSDSTQPAQQPGGGGQGNAQTQQLIHNVVQLMPLRSENFDFSRVQAFFRAYEDLLRGTNSQQLSAVQTLMGQVVTARQEITPLLNSAMYNFSLAGDASMVVQWLRPPQFKNYVPFVQKLMAALEATKNAISMFYSSYVDPKSNADPKSKENRVGLNPDQQQIVAGQFMGDSYYQRNRYDMEDWLNNSDQVTGLKR